MELFFIYSSMFNNTYDIPVGQDTPYYILDENRLLHNLELIKSVSANAGVEIILAFKAYALWKTFPVFRRYIHFTTASSPYEARLAKDEFGSLAHTYSPAYETKTFREIMECSKSITFNSLTQYSNFYPLIKEWNASSANHKITVGLRINPERSEITTEIYNPCAPGTRFGIAAEKIPKTLPPGVEGFHCHCHCENDSHALERTLLQIENKFGRWLPSLKWLNLGGGHLMTHKDYDTKHLVSVLKEFKARHPELQIILEPGSAFAWQTGELVATVVDIVEDKGIKTAVLNTSFTCHMPDCLEMPYHPAVLGAETLENCDDVTDPCTYRLGGNSCLSGDYMGYWKFKSPLKTGDDIVFLDMIHYTTVKTNMFNGINHPSILFRRSNGKVDVLRQYTYEDYRDRMD